MTRSTARGRFFLPGLPLFLMALISGVLFFLFQFSTESVEYVAGNNNPLPASTPPAAKAVTHLKTPAAVKTIYMTQCVAGLPSFRESLVKLVETTELNSLVIDIKDYSGTVSFLRGDEETGPGCQTKDLKEFIETLHQKEIYVIGRITAFQDPYYTKIHPELAVKKRSDGSVWRDHKGLSFIDVASRPYWDYIVALAKDSYALGFDELNFDYIRYPSDGDMSDIKISDEAGRSKAEVLEKFFQYLSDNLKPLGVVMSADLFGMTTTNLDDLNIGQQLERALPYFDYIAPMVYPSHYPPHFNGWLNPNEHPYDIVKFSLDKAVERTVATTTLVDTLTHEFLNPNSTSTPAIYRKQAYSKEKIRPWLQDFNYPVTYTPAMVKAQIQATYDSGLQSWMLWSPSNKYTLSALDK